MAELTRARALRRMIEAEREGRPFVVVETDGRVLDVVELTGEEALIGRSTECDVVLEDPRVSRLHARLERVPGGWVAADEGLARNGCWLNGRRLLGRHRLADRDVLLLGKTTLTFRSPEAATSSASTLVSSPMLKTMKMTPAQRRVLIELIRPCWGEAIVVPASNQTIAARLYLSVDTVKSHLRALFEQLAVGDLPHNVKRARLVETVTRLGILTDADFEERG